MRILVHEFVSGGGLAGQPLTPSLAREGGAMLTALVADLAALGRHQILATRDRRCSPAAPPGVEVVTLEPATREARLDELIASVDAVWPIAPESGGSLERLAARIEQKRKIVLGSSAAAVHRAADKAGLARRLECAGVSHPKTVVLRSDRRCDAAASTIGYPLIVKPVRGAGCTAVYYVRTGRDLRPSIHKCRRTCGREPLIVQAFEAGTPASVSLLADGCRAVVLAVNGQSLSGRRELSYHGGITPLDHPRAGRAADAAVRTCRALPGLRGYIGVDLVLTASEAVIIEVNPRLTTAYLGLRRAIDENIAALALDACLGSLPAPPPVRRRVRFEPDGRFVVIQGHAVRQPQSAPGSQRRYT